MTKDTKYALYKYSTENVGDEIQSIAARRFLPRVDYYIDRDQIGEWHNDNQNEQVKLIANGWYMREPFEWPPRDTTIDPLLISMYIEPKPVGDTGIIPREVFASSESRQYLRDHGPVGARDQFTLKFLQDNQIDSYFSGCITLTLQRDQSIKKRDFILAIDVSDRLYDFMVTKTDRKIIRLSPYGDFSLAEADRLPVAEYFLYLYQSAHAIVTTRLHATLPSLALRTPVLLIKDKKHYDPNRYAGLADLARSVTDDQYIANYDLFNLDNPGDNPDDYRSIRRNLIRRCSEFTGYNNTKSFLSASPSSLLLSDSLINVFADSFHKRFLAMIGGMDVDWYRLENIKLAKQIDQLSGRVAELEQANHQLHWDNMALNGKYRDLAADYNRIKNTSLYYLARGAKRHLRRSK